MKLIFLELTRSTPPRYSQLDRESRSHLAWIPAKAGMTSDTCLYVVFLIRSVLCCSVKNNHEEDEAMHCSLEFSSIGLPVVVHSQWDEHQTRCDLCIFTAHPQALIFLEGLSDEEEARDFEKCLNALRHGENPLDDFVRLEGDPALSLTSFLVKLYQEVQVGPRILDMLELMGFWEPPAKRKPSAGMIMWFHPEDEYRTVLVHSREQAMRVIRGLPGMGTQRRQRLLAQIRKWNLPHQCPDDTLQEIKGVIAELLCKASMATKISSAMSAQSKANWN